MLTVIIPSFNEENYIKECLAAISRQAGLPENHAIEVIVAANGCKDQTVELAKAMQNKLESSGFDLCVLDIAKGNKINALNEADSVASYPTRVYLDADVVIGPNVLAELADILSEDRPLYASGTVHVPKPRNLFSRAYAKIWTNLPFVKHGVPGIGLYAMNAKGRARWGVFPDVCADDRFVRLQFSADERRKASAVYDWPLPEGLSNLIKVRHRWRQGNMELDDAFPELLKNDGEKNETFGNALGLLRTPFSSAVFVLVYLISNARAKRARNNGSFAWQRGRT